MHGAANMVGGMVPQVQRKNIVACMQDIPASLILIVGIEPGVMVISMPCGDV